MLSGFGGPSVGDRRVITMKWVVAGVAPLAPGARVAAVTVAGSGGAAASAARAVAIATIPVLAVVSLLAGLRIAFLPCRLCALVAAASAVPIGLGAWL